MYELIERINEATDVKKFKVDELDKLAAEIREALFNRLTKIGGHFGPNFGIVEAEIALHYVFNSPTDQFVFDVSHQSYPHKILTGRKAGYIYEDHFRRIQVILIRMRVSMICLMWDTHLHLFHLQQDLLRQEI